MFGVFVFEVGVMVVVDGGVVYVVSVGDGGVRVNEVEVGLC